MPDRRGPHRHDADSPRPCPRSHNAPHRRCPSRASGRCRTAPTAERATSSGPREASERASDQDPPAPDRRPDSPIRREPARPTARDPVRDPVRARASARGRTTRRTRDAHVARSAAAGRSERQNMRPRPPNERHAAVHDRHLRTGDRTARVAARLAISAPAPEVAQHTVATAPRSHEPSPHDGPGGSPCDLGTRRQPADRDRTTRRTHDAEVARTVAARRTKRQSVRPRHGTPQPAMPRHARTTAPTNATTDQDRMRNERRRAHATGVEPRRFELLTSALQRQRSTN